MRINVVYPTPRSSSAFQQDHDGFLAAMEIVARTHDVTWLNVHPYNRDHRANARRIRDADFILIRSDWSWYPSTVTDRALWGKTDTPVGLLIAGSSHAPSPPCQQRYEVLFCETPWYSPFVAEHPFTVEAFGVDTRYMYEMHLTARHWDYLLVGRLAYFKGPNA